VSHLAFASAIKSMWGLVIVESLRDIFLKINGFLDLLKILEATVIVNDFTHIGGKIFSA
jgi:hypothetical protein